MLGPQVAVGPHPAEVGGLVPAVARGAQRPDDAFEVGLHRLGLAFQLGSVGVREAGARLSFQLVCGDVLGLERHGLGEVACEVGGLLARDAVDEVERDVVKSGITQTIEGASDVVRLGNAPECPQEPWREGLRPDRDARDPATGKQAGKGGRHRLGIRLDRHLAGRGE